MKKKSKKQTVSKRKKGWCVYILECCNSHLYTGITADLERRFKQHQSGHGGKFTRTFGVKELLYSERSCNRSTALKREAEIKRWPREKKLDLILRQSEQVEGSAL